MIDYSLLMKVLNKCPNDRDKTILADADIITVIIVFYINEQSIINSHCDDRLVS
jgi:hypothetical protein